MNYYLCKKYCSVLILLVVGMVAHSQSESSKNGFTQFKYPNGQVSAEGKMVDGKPVGIWKNYFPTGVLKSEGKRDGAAADSAWIFYDENGVFTEVIDFVGGKKSGEKKIYNEEGFLVKKERWKNDTLSGVTYRYFTNGSVNEEIPYSRGKKDGLALTYNEEGTIHVLTYYTKDFLDRKELINRKNKAGQKVGMWKTFWPKDTTRKLPFTIRKEGTYKTGLRHGYWREYDRNGELLSTTKYVDGKVVENAIELAVVDVQERIWPNGKLREKGGYMFGKKEGTHTFYNREGAMDSAKIYRLGKLIAVGGTVDNNGVKQGYWREYYQDGTLRAEGEYVDGLKVKMWKFFHPNGKLEQKGAYKAEERPDGAWRWYYNNSQVRREMAYYRGKPEGDIIEYSDSGTVILQGQYLDGLEEEDWFIDVGDHKEEGKYVAGLKDGEWVHTYSNGEKNFVGEYVQGLEEGKHIFYHSNGKKALEGKYYSGVKEGTWKRYDKEGITALEIEYAGGKIKRMDGVKIKEKK